MKKIGVLIFFLFVASSCWPQKKYDIKKSWIKVSIEDLTGKQNGPDTLYTRYTLGNRAFIGFNPGWDDYTFEWSRDKDNVTIGFDTYLIEELTDTSLVIFEQNFRRTRFLSEDFLRSDSSHLQYDGIFQNKPLYEANKYFSARFKKGESLRDALKTHYDVNYKAYFRMTFIIDEEGIVKDVRVINSIYENYDNEMVELLKKTSKKWAPAYYKGKPIQTRLFFDVKYLGSIAPTIR